MASTLATVSQSFAFRLRRSSLLSYAPKPRGFDYSHTAPLTMVVCGAAKNQSKASVKKLGGCPFLAPGNKKAAQEMNFVEEMRAVAMRLHTKDQAKEGEMEAGDMPPIALWQPTAAGYVQFLVDSKLVYDTLESAVQKRAHPSYTEFVNTGLERSESLARDLEWFQENGHVILKASHLGITYSNYVEELSETDPQAFIRHFFNIYFAHTAGGRMIGKMVAQRILKNKELEFYRWDGDLSILTQNVKDKLNKVASNWSREEKDHCLEETEKSFKFSGELLRFIIS